MLGETAVATVITNLIHQHKVDQWSRLLLSVTASALTTFFGVFGLTGIGLLAAGKPLSWSIVYSIFQASVAMAAIALFRWRSSPLTKDLPISVPGSVNVVADKILQEQNVVTYNPDKK
jgi:hypothetical protein